MRYSVMAQTTMKIDTELLADLKELANDSYRSPQKQLQFLVDQARGTLRSSKTADSEVFLGMMDHLVEQSEQGLINDVEQDYVQQLLGSGAKLYGDNELGEFEQYTGSENTLATKTP